MTRNVAILIFPHVEVLDFCGPYEVFGVTGRTDPVPFHVYTIAASKDPVWARNGLSVNPAYTLEDCPAPDLLLIPGGWGTRALLNDETLLEWIKAQSERVELLLSVCTGSLLLAKAGLLEGLSATTHFGSLDLLQTLSPSTTVQRDERFVDNGTIITSAGISAGIDMSLYVVSKLLGKEVADDTARHMQYDYWK